MTILDKIADRTRIRVARAKNANPLALVQANALALTPPRTAFPFAQALAKDGLSFICEVKKASPSKGLIAPHFPYLEIAKDYETAGADAVSVLTEPEFFLGDTAYLREIADSLSIPALRKDFIVDPYQIYESRLLGASAILLICALLDEHTLADFLNLAKTLGLDALVEAHSETETIMAVNAGASLIGINNRDLKTFTVDFSLTARLRGKVPDGVLMVAESGVQSPEDIRALSALGVDAALIGESLMRAPNRISFLHELRAASRL